MGSLPTIASPAVREVPALVLMTWNCSRRISSDHHDHVARIDRLGRTARASI
jgi:hypothetical protein